MKTIDTMSVLKMLAFFFTSMQLKSPSTPKPAERVGLSYRENGQMHEEAEGGGTV